MIDKNQFGILAVAFVWFTIYNTRGVWPLCYKKCIFLYM